MCPARLCVALILLLVGTVATATAEQDTTASVRVGMSAAVYDSMEQAYDLWLQRVVSPHWPDSDPVTLTFDERNLGPRDAAKDVQAGRAQLAIVDRATAAELVGAARSDGQTPPGRRLRVLTPAYKSALVFLMVPRFGAATGPPPQVGALKDRRIMFWPPSHNAADTTAAGAVLRQLGLGFTPRYSQSLPFGLVEMDDGDLDAVALLSGLPLHALEKFAANYRLTVFGFSDNEMTRIMGQLPVFDFYDIPPGGVGYRPGDGSNTRVPLNPTTIHTLGVWNFVVVPQEMPACVAYRIVDAVMTAAEKANYGLVELPANPQYNQEAAYVDLSGTRAENLEQDQEIPLHAGATLWLQTHHKPVPTWPRPDRTPEICP